MSPSLLAQLIRRSRWGFVRVPSSPSSRAFREPRAAAEVAGFVNRIGGRGFDPALPFAFAFARPRSVLAALALLGRFRPPTTTLSLRPLRGGFAVQLRSSYTLAPRL